MISLNKNLHKIRKVLRIVYVKVKLRHSQKGKRVVACKPLKVLNPQYFAIGDYCYLGPNCRIEAWNSYNNKRFTPKIILGHDVRINSTCHIGAINKVIIGNECLLGSHVMIIDHSHGRNTVEELELHPSDRDLYSKGEIIIGNRCWICENAVILPGVHIGQGSVIGANSVVTKDIPPYSIACGNPAKVIRKIKKSE